MLHISDFPSFSRLNSIPSHTHKYICIYRYHSLSIDSLIDRYLGCFYIFVIANSATINTGMPVSLKRSWFQLFPKHIQKWDCWIIWWLYFDFLRKLYCFSQKQLYHFASLQTVCKSFRSFNFSISSWILFFFLNSSH